MHVSDTNVQGSPVGFGFSAGDFARIAALALVLTAAGALAFALGLQSAGLALMAPLAALAVFVMLMSPPLVIGLLIFCQQNDVLIGLTGIENLNKLLAVAAIASVLLRCFQWSHIRATFIAGAPVYIALATLALLSGLSVFTADDPGLATRETLRYVNLCVLVGIVAFGLKDIRAVQFVLLAIVIAMLPSAAVTLMDFVTGEQMFEEFYTEDMGVGYWEGQPRSRGTTLESVPMAATMLLGGVAVSMVMALFGQRWRIFYAISGMLGAIAILTTLTRSATLTMCICVLVILWWARKEYYFGRLLAAMSVAAAIAVAVAPDTVWTKFTAATTIADRTVERRFGYQIIGIDLVSKYPLTGVGAGNYPIHYEKDDYNFVPGRYEETRPLHNIYLQYAAELGLAGLILFLTLLVSALILGLRATYSIDKRLRGVSEASVLCLLAMSVQFAFLSSSAVPHFWIAIGLIVVVYRLYREEVQNI